MLISTIYPRTYLSPVDLGDKEFTLKIVAVKAENVFVPGENKKARRAVVMFAKAKRGLLLSAHNAHAIEALYGPETDDWVGKSVTLYVERGIKAFGKVHDVVRVKRQNGGLTEIPDREDPPEPEDTGDILPDDSPSRRDGLLVAINGLIESGYFPDTVVARFRAEADDLTDDQLEVLHDEMSLAVNTALDAEAAGA